jgi:NADPH-dependent 2,4-dienoyl-CoA reductase/sulfur reductase-like enzyme
MEAARIATLRGHKVVLFEEHDHLGGALALSAMIPQRPGWAELRDYLTGELNRLGVDVRLGTRATAELAKREEAEVAIVAVGASQVRLDIPGIEQENVVLSRDILEGKARVLGKNVVVIGSSVSGAQIADFLAEKGHDVAIVGATKEIAISAAVVVRNLLLERLKQRGKDTHQYQDFGHRKRQSPNRRPKRHRKPASGHRGGEPWHKAQRWHRR